MATSTSSSLAVEAFADREALSAALADLTASDLRAALSARGRAALAVSGGSTPGPAYRRLSAMDLAWRDVQVALVDERWVAPNADASNEKLIRTTLLTNAAKDARFIGMKTDHATPFDAVEAVDAVYRAVDEFDVAILGMGPDGHTASWFPHAEGLDHALAPQDGARVGAITAQESAVTGAHVDRMTLTAPPILAARRVVIALTGAQKRAVLDEAMNDGPAADMPVRQVLRDGSVNLTIYWAP